MASLSKEDEEASPFLSHSPSSDEDFTTTTLFDQSHYTPWRWWTIIASICVGAALASVLWLIAWSHYFGIHSRYTTSPPTDIANCGSDHESAIANNCTFQLWSYSWVPQQCFDKELHDEFLALQAKEDWHYYSSVVPPVTVSLESVLTGTRNDLHSTWGQHFWHCAFYQRKFFRIVEEHDGKREPTLKMTNRDLDMHHSAHCNEWLAKPDAYRWDDPRINLTVGYHSCS